MEGSNVLTNDSKITNREKEVLEMLCQGLTAKEIGHSLHISTCTVESHRRNMIVKFDARNTVHMVVRALRGISPGEIFVLHVVSDSDK